VKNVIKKGIRKLVEGVDLASQEAKEIMKEIMLGRATEAQIGAFLTALRMKGETIQEISAFASVMREFCCRIYPKVNGRLVDTCGTGGDKVKTFNVSTVAAFVVAGAGIPVAKHGNRSVTSKCGSADVLERLGLNLNLEPKAVEKIIEEVGIGFMFAPKFHPAMKHAIGSRREIGIRTIFNVLGPLTNPAGDLDCEEAMVVHGLDGLDEISIIGKTSIAWLRAGEVSLIRVTPEEFGFKKATLKEISGTTSEESVEIAFKLLNNILDSQDPRRNIVLLNAAAGVVVGCKADDLSDGIELAVESIESGAAYKKLRMMIKASGGEMTRLEELEKKYA